MHHLRLNGRGQFTIIAAMLVAVVLIAAVMTTYSAIRYTEFEEQPRILSAVDEINLALKHVLGFTVGYYGSVLQVTGNTTYARELASNYLRSGLVNIGDIRPEWSPSFTINYFNLSTYWFANASYSAGNFSVSYDLTGLGVFGMNYSTSCRLNVEVLGTTPENKTRISITKDDGEPVVTLGRQSFKFYKYIYSNLTWEYVSPSDEPRVYANGTYEITVPSGINSRSYVVRVEDSRGIVVVACSFSRYIVDLEWDTTQTEHYVELISDVDGVPDKGAHNNFTAQQYGPDDIIDTITEASEIASPLYNATYWVPLGSTTCSSGVVNDLQTDNNVYMQLRSYPTAYSSTDYSTIEFDNANSTSTSSSNSLSWWHTTGLGPNRILLVAVDVFRSSGTPTTVTGVTYDGVALTQVATAMYSTDPRVRSYVFMLTNPPPGTKLIIVNFAASTSAVAGSVTYTNVNQTNPILANNTASGSGTTASVSITASGSYSKMLYGHLGTYRTQNPASYTVSEGSGQTNRWAQSSSQYKGRASDKSVTNGSASMSWTISNTASWVAIAVLLQPTLLPTEYTCTAEFIGSSTTANWEWLTWTIDGSATIADVGVTFQLYNFTASQYPTSGYGYIPAIFQTTDQAKIQNITINPADFRNSTGHWKLKITATKATSTQFDLKLDLLRFNPGVTTYTLELEEQWTNINTTGRYELCIKTGALSNNEHLKVDVRSGTGWVTVIDALQPNEWKNVSVTQYITSPTFTIRFKGGEDYPPNLDSTQDSWEIDAVLLKNKTASSFLLALNESTLVVELLQNGTMRWLGQGLQMTTQALPIPPVPVKAIHVSQTRNGVDQPVPFQVEDWASEYRIPQGLTNNATVFSNRQMIVFLVDVHVSKITIWWNGSDEAVQTPLAYNNTHFSDNPNNRILNNGRVRLQVTSTGFNINSTVGSVNSTANLMRINNTYDTTNPEWAWVIVNGVVRSIIQGEAEWSGGISGCPNVYSNIVITLPANVTYYTYQLRLMFINSTQPRTIRDLCPIQLSTNLSSIQMMTENGTANGFPIVNSTGAFYNYNYTSESWTAHHWSQIITDTKGAGIMFTDNANQQLYAFDAIGPSAGTPTGALNVTATTNGLIQLQPVTIRQVQFQDARDFTWHGAVVTFDGTTPIYRSSDESGLWILVEYPPTATVTTES